MNVRVQIADSTAHETRAYNANIITDKNKKKQILEYNKEKIFKSQFSTHFDVLFWFGC